MANHAGAKIGRTVRYKTAAGKWRPGRITAVTSQAIVTILDADRTTIYTDKIRRGTPVNPTSVDKWSL